MLVALAVVVVAVCALHETRTPIVPPPLGPPGPAGLGLSYAVIAGRSEVYKPKVPNTLILEVDGLPPDSLVGCPVHIQALDMGLAGFNRYKLHLAAVMPHAGTIAGGGSATLYLRPRAGKVIKAGINVTNRFGPLGYMTAYPCR